MAHWMPVNESAGSVWVSLETNLIRLAVNPWGGVLGCHRTEGHWVSICMFSALSIFNCPVIRITFQSPPGAATCRITIQSLLSQGLWSVMMRKGWTVKYWWKRRLAHMIAHSSTSYVGQRVADFVNLWLLYAVTFFHAFCDRTHPTDVLDASLKSRNSHEKSGYERMGVLHRARWRLSNALCSTSIHKNVFPFCVRACRGSDILENCQMKRQGRLSFQRGL